MAETDPYYQFPLYALNYKNPLTALNYIISYSISKVGEHFLDYYEGIHMKKALELLEETSYYDQWKEVLSAPNCLPYRHTCVIVGSMKCNVTLPTETFEYLDATLEEADEIERFVGGRYYPQVRIRYDYLWEMINFLRKKVGENYPVGREAVARWNQFRVLCAILSKVGNKRFSKCTWREIQARSAGFKGIEDYKAYKSYSCADYYKQDELSRDQIRKIVNDLEFYKVVTKIQYSRSESYFSFKNMSVEELVTAIYKEKHKREERLFSNVKEVERVKENLSKNK